MAGIEAETRPQGHEDAVVFACDMGHLPLAAFAADRIRRVEPARAFDITVCMPDIADLPDWLRDGPTRFCQISTSALPKVETFRSWISAATYFRWVLPGAFEGAYRSLLYLDTDTYQARDGIGALFAGLDRPVPLAAVEDFQYLAPLHGKTVGHLEALRRDLGGPEGQYYNAGVLLIQPGPFAAQDGFSRLLDGVARNAPFDPVYGEQDQGALNLAFAGDLMPLSPRFNWCARPFRNPILTPRYDPVILHFAGRNKPWQLQDDPFVAQFTAEYRDWLARHFPGFQPKPVRGSAAERLAAPKYRIGALNTLRVALYRRRFLKEQQRIWSRDMDEKIRRMDAAMARAVVGRAV
ncbi:MAG: hypothetical protein KDA50_06150 [Rhodobacteraceae bacterium]|nr:hypothetical protein [Paracoccaceae bacterium]